MATFKVQIEDLVGAVGDDAALTQWLTDGVKEITNILPPDLKEKCMTETTLSNSPETMDLDVVGSVLYVTRLSANSGGKRLPCRQVPISYADSANDSTSLHFASVTDPVYFISSSGDAVILSVLPTPTADQTAIVYHLGYTAAAHGDSVIANFPDEAEHLVVLYASIKAVEFLMVSEEDPELFAPIIATLKQDYDKGIKILAGGTAPKQSQKLGDIAIPG